MKKTTKSYADQSSDETIRELNTDQKQGLSSEEVAKRPESYGYNEKEEKEESLWHRVFRRFCGPIPWVIELAALLSAIVQKWEDFIIIMIMLSVNASLGFFQKYRALNALKTLKQQLTNEVVVIRDRVFKSY